MPKEYDQTQCLRLISRYCAAYTRSFLSCSLSWHYMLLWCVATLDFTFLLQ